MNSASLLIFAALMAGSTAEYFSSTAICIQFRGVSVDHYKKVDCGHAGITTDQCEAKGCCFDDSTGWGIPQCFYPFSNIVKPTNPPRTNPPRTNPPRTNPPLTYPPPTNPPPVTSAKKRCGATAVASQQLCGDLTPKTKEECDMIGCCHYGSLCLTPVDPYDGGNVDNVAAAGPQLSGSVLGLSNGIPKSGSVQASLNGGNAGSIQTDAFGNKYYIDANGHQVYLPPDSQSVQQPLQPKAPEQPQSQGQVYYDERGEPYYIDAYGKRVYYNTQTQAPPTQPPYQPQQYCAGTSQLCYPTYPKLQKATCESYGCCVAYDGTCRKRPVVCPASGQSCHTGFGQITQQQCESRGCCLTYDGRCIYRSSPAQGPPQPQPSKYPQTPSGGSGGKGGGDVIANLGNKCQIANSIENQKLREEYQSRFKCTGLEGSVSKDDADNAVQNILGGLLPSNTPQNKPQNQGGPIGAYTPNFGPSGNRPPVGNSKICDLIKSQDSIGKFGTMLSQQYGCPSSSPFGSFGGIPFDVFAALLGLEEEEEYKEGAIDPDKIPYDIVEVCIEKRFDYRTCKEGININIRTSEECFNIGCMYYQGYCFKCTKIPASAYILQDSAETCRVSDDDRDTCPGYQTFLLTTLMSGQSGQSGGINSLLPFLLTSQDGDGGGLDSQNLALIMSMMGQGGAGGGNLGALMPLLLSGSGSGSSNNLALMSLLSQQGGGGGGFGGAGGAGGAGGLGGMNPLLLSSLFRSGGGGDDSSSNQRGIGDLLGSSGGLGSLLGAGGGGGAGLSSLLGSGGSGNNALLSSLLGGGGAGSNPLFNSLIGGGNSEASDEAAKQRRFFCERKGCCWKTGGGFGGTCHAKGLTIEKNCLPERNSGDCGKGGSSVIARLIGGDTVSSRKARPWMALIKKAGSSRVHCGGVLICSQWVMTIASCLSRSTSVKNSQIFIPDLDPLTIDVFVGSTNPNNVGATHKVDVTEIVPHPRFSASQHYNDIALLKIRSFGFTQTRRPACLPSLNTARLSEVPDSGDTLYMTGFGKTALLAQSKLNELRFVVKSSSYCNKKYPGAVPESGVFCAEAPISKIADTCDGDGGSPIMSYNSGDDAWTVVGLNYGGSSDCSGSLPSLFTKVSTFMGWIAQTTNGCCATPTFRGLS